MKSPRLLLSLLVGMLVPYSLTAASGDPAPRPDPSVLDREESLFADSVRPDFFAGMNGDDVRFERAMRLCETILARDPQNAPAMVWHGSGLLVRSVHLRRQGNVGEAELQFQNGLQEMNRAVALAPNDIHVLLPRGATLLSVSAAPLAPDLARNLLQQGVQDYEKVLALQASYFDKLPIHARGELLSGLANGWERLGNEVNARQYHERIVQDCPGSSYALESEAWLRQAAARSPHTCKGCHIQ